MDQLIDDKKSTILFVPNNGCENLEFLKVFADGLRDRGHRVVFALNVGNEELVINNNLSHLLDLNKLSKNWMWDMDVEDSNLFRRPAIEVFECFTIKCLWKKFAELRKRDYYLKKLIKHFKPNLIVVESILCSPAVTDCGIPWVWINFGAPNLFMDNSLLPPMWSGFSMNSSEILVKKFTEKRDQLMQDFMSHYNKWLISMGLRGQSVNALHPHSPYLNLYFYPQEIDYQLKDDYLPDNWYQFCCLMKAIDNTNNIEIPIDLMNKREKIIHFAFKSYDNSYNSRQLISRLFKILSQLPNKFVLIDDQLYKDYSIPSNFYLLDYLSTDEAIHISDLVITNGDTPTITKAMFYGKPMIVMPMFGEQLDNARYLKESGFGVTLEPYTCHLSTTYGSINALLEDKSLHKRLDIISYKMQNSSDIKTICTAIEQLF